MTQDSAQASSSDQPGSGIGQEPPKTHPKAEPDAELVALAERLGFTELRMFDRDHGDSPLLHARWKGAPVALSQRTGLAGSIGIAFYRGPQPVTIDPDGEQEQDSPWDEVLDTTWPDPGALLVIAAAVLADRSDGREAAYQGIDW